MADKQPAGSRGPQLNIKLGEDEKRIAEAVAKERGLNISGLVRLLILDEARRLGIK
jgi:antitoxin component of RelBE/YafQ-DinJ toxin-antitoxin module